MDRDDYSVTVDQLYKLRVHTFLYIILIDNGHTFASIVSFEYITVCSRSVFYKYVIPKKYFSKGNQNIITLYNHLAMEIKCLS